MIAYSKRLLTITLAALIFVSCGHRRSFHLLSGSENEPLQSLIKEYAEKQGYDIDFTYKGSVDIMLELQSDFRALTPLVRNLRYARTSLGYPSGAGAVRQPSA